MVIFEGGRLVIVVETKSPAEDWKNIVDGVIDLLQSESENMSKSRYEVLELLRQMIPESGQIKMN